MGRGWWTGVFVQYYPMRADNCWHGSLPSAPGARPLIPSLLLLAALVVPAVIGMRNFERRVALTSTAATAVLVVVVLTASQILLVSMLLGSIGLFSRVFLLGVNAVVSAGVLLVARRLPERLRPPPADIPASNAPRAARIICLGLACYALARWTANSLYVGKRGFQEWDTLAYHLGIAARFAQVHSIVHPVLFYPQEPAITFFPLNGELLESISMAVTGTDYWVAFFNVFWLAVLLLSAWVLGRRFGAGHLFVGAVAALASLPLMVDSFAGTGMVDIFGAAMLVAAIALLSVEGFRSGSLLVAGLGSGLAGGAKYTMLPAVVLLGSVLAVWLWRRHQAQLIWAWAAGSATTGIYWYVKNLAVAGSPLPVMRLGIGPVAFPSAGVTSPEAWSILHYLGQPTILHEIFSHYYTDFGPLTYVLMAVVGLGVVAGLIFSRDAWGRALAVLGTICTLAFLATPQTAWGPAGHPELSQVTDYNARYGLLALLFGLMALAALPWLRRPAVHTLAVGVLSLIALASLIPMDTLISVSDRVSYPSLGTALPQAPLWPGVAVVALIAGVGWGFRRGIPARGAAFRQAPACVAALALATTGPALGYQIHHPIQAANSATAWYIQVYDWAYNLSHAHIGVVGMLDYYPLYGRDLSNRVDYIGWTGPHERFSDFTDCKSFVEALDAGHYDYLVAAETNFPYPSGPPVGNWLGSDPHVSVVLKNVNQTVFQVKGPVSPSNCP